jgi:hypothetical protein
MGGGESEVGYLDFFSFLFCMCFLLVQSMKNERVGGGRGRGGWFLL